MKNLIIREIIGKNKKINKVLDNYNVNQWHEDSDGTPFIIMFDDESDSFIVFITDFDLHHFDIFSSNTYLSLNTQILYKINQIIEEFCEE